MFKLFKRLIFSSLVQLVFVLVIASMFYSKLHPDTVRFFLTVSTCLKGLLVFVLPLLLFSFVAVALSSIPRDGMLFILGLMVIVFISNFINVLISGAVGFFVLSGTEARMIPEDVAVFTPFFEMNLPQIAGTAQSLFAGIIVGLANSFHPNKYVSITIKFIHECVMKFMKKFFVPLLPIFVGGFLLKLLSEGKMLGFVGNNTKVCVITCGFLWIYLGFWLLTASSFKVSRAIEIFKTTFPAIVTAFSTMSSAAALPMSLNAAEKNTGDKMLADAVMPITLNFHMVGDTIIVPIMALMVLLVFDHPLPSAFNFILFGVFFILNKFAGGGVPSGTIMVTVPVLEKYLGFDSSMTAFIIALYGVIDPITSSGNVAANNFFIIIFQKIRSFIKGLTSKQAL
ncbi:MAG: dicarboxylate/amino acid:cation symporter [Holosporales bacterium]|jgi:Na+/H+-dicarboxylate symporter|nr:dicarboxylate/amino acid:cation symporter [Holosporales bacterium]